MNNFLKILCLFIIFNSISATPVNLASLDVFACTATKIDIVVYAADASNTRLDYKNVMNYSAIVSARSVPNSKMTDLSITDMTLESIDPTLYNLGKGLFPSVTVDFNAPQSCSGNCHFTVGNGTFQINFPFMVKDVTSFQTLISNVIDEGAISTAYGKLLEGDNPCFDVAFSPSTYSHVTFNVNQCCIKDVRVPKPVTPSKICTKFNSSTTFYRNANKFANIFADLTFNDAQNEFSTAVMDSGSDFIDYFNFTTNAYDAFCAGPAGTRQTCTNDLDSLDGGDFKALFQVTVATSVPKQGFYTANVGRVINRNRVPLKEEGKRFTPESPCSYTSGAFEGNAVTYSSQFCCDQFSG